MAKKSATTASILVFLGGLIYVYLTWTLGLYGGAWSVNSPTSPLGLWLPILAASAVISAISLLLLGVVGLKGNADMMSKEGAMKAIWLGGFALLALTAGTVNMWITIFAFLISYAGVDWADM